MFRLKPILLMTMLTFADTAQAQEAECPALARVQVAEQGEMLQALVELWWARKRLPMRLIPDHVALERDSENSYIVHYLRHGCAIASLQLPAEQLQRFLRKRIGLEA